MINANKGLLIWALVLTAFVLMGVTNVFTPGTTISAAEVNANFAELQAAVDALQDPSLQGTVRAYGYIDGDGTVLKSFNRGGGPVTVSHVAASGNYEITIPGLNYTFTEDPTFVTVVELGARIPNIAQLVAPPRLRVQIRDAAGAVDDCNFWFVILNR